MTLDLFQQLLPRAQLLAALCEGTYLARRWEEEGAIALYYLPNGGRGFFVEVGYDAYQQGGFVLRSFSSNVPLEEYTHGVRLPRA
jgi:hypothetical protein